MNKYLITLIIIIVVFLIAFYGIPSNKIDDTSEVMSAITVSESSYDFGDIDIFGGKVSTTYVLKNDGLEDVSILSAQTSCMCTEGEIGGLKFGMHESSGNTIIIPAGEEEILTAIYDPLAHGPDGVGKAKREIFLKTNSTSTPEIKVTFTVNVTKNETE